MVTETPEIPKIIHYCWFGGKPLPLLAKKCIDSWKKFLPEYEIKQWDESNFDVNIIPYTSQAYEAKKYAFVSDYARLWLLYKYGGLYFDTDVEVIKPLDNIISSGAFMGCENKFNPNMPPVNLHINPGLGLGALPMMNIFHELLELYDSLQFIKEDGSLNLKTIVEYTSELFVQHGLKNCPNIQRIEGISIYPWDYFCPMTPTLIMNLTENSVTIHHYSASWEDGKVRLRRKIKRSLGSNTIKYIQPLIEKFHRFFQIFR